MVFERLELGLDIKKLVDDFRLFTRELTPVMQSQGFGGWAVLSSNGDYRDGWQQGHRCYSQENGRDVLDSAKVEAIGLLGPAAYKIPTQICRGAVAEAIRRVHALGLCPRRARISLLRAGGATSWHRDAPDEAYSVRLHVPLLTNPEACLEVEGEAEHIDADGAAYFLRVNRLHRALNFGAEDRYHLIMDVLDTRGVSEFHRLPTSQTGKNLAATRAVEASGAPN